MINQTKVGETQAVLGVDIGGTKLAVGVVTPDGRVHGRVEEPTRVEDGHEVILPRLWAMARTSMELATSAGRSSAIAAVGIGCGGPLDAAHGVLTGPFHLPGWVDIPIVAIAESEFGVPVALENDASAAALGEYRFGAGRGASTMLYLTISTGVGGGAVFGGKLHRGAAGNGGEFGHIVVRTDGRPCLCGRRGCLEAYVAGSSIGARAQEAIDGGRASSPASSSAIAPTGSSTVSPITAQDVWRAAEQGDPLAREIWDETTELLGVGLTDLVNAFEPDVVVLGGGVTRSGAALIDPVREAVRLNAMPPAAAAVRIELAAHGDDVGIVGAAAIAFALLEDRASA